MSASRGPAATLRTKETTLDHDNIEPPLEVRWTAEEALELLATLEDARDALIDANQLTVTLQVEDQIRQLSRRLNLEFP